MVQQRAVLRQATRGYAADPALRGITYMRAPGETRKQTKKPKKLSRSRDRQGRGGGSPGPARRAEEINAYRAVCPRVR